MLYLDCGHRAFVFDMGANRMNGHEKIKEAIIAAKAADVAHAEKRAEATRADSAARESWQEVMRIMHAVLGSRDTVGVIYEGALYRVDECNGSRRVMATLMEAEVLT